MPVDASEHSQRTFWLSGAITYFSLPPLFSQTSFMGGPVICTFWKLLVMHDGIAHGSMAQRDREWVCTHTEQADEKRLEKIIRTLQK